MSTQPDPSLTDDPRPLPGSPSGISVIIVGAGIGGLACAIESRLQGHSVLIFEQASEFKPFGDNLGLFPNSGRFVKRWGIHHELSKYCAYPDGLIIRKYDGTFIVHQNHKKERKEGEKDPFAEAPLYDTTRKDLHRIMIARAKELGAELHMGVRVDKYIENADSASIEVKGKTYTADVVVGADGVKSKARELVLGIYDAPKASGYAIFRTAYSADLIRANPLCAHLAPEGRDSRTIWIGPDMHFIHGTSRNGKEIHWLLTHLDTADVEESWMLPGNPEDALAVVKDWDPVMSAVINTTPPGALIDWKLVFRDPLPRWVSDTGRICVMGDAAHPFLPTSQQGASQAVEDGVTIAHTLTLAKQRGHPLGHALKAYEALRSERVRRAQQVGVDNRNMWHKLDYSKDIDPESVKLPFATWLWEHDATAYAKEHYDDVVARDFAITKPAPKADIVHEALEQPLNTQVPVQA